MRRLVRSDYGPAALAALLALGLYLRTLAPGLLGGDSGEFQFAAWVTGLAHPTGYPLYLILGYLWSHLLPWGDPAGRLNLLSALFGALAVGLVYLLAVRTLRLAGPAHQTELGYRLLAAVTAATFAASPTFWSQAVIAEVYALNAALVAGLLLTLVTWAADPVRDRPLYVGAAIFGLGLAHHRTIVLYSPAILLFLVAVTARQPVRRPWGPRLLRALPWLLAPLLLYLYIPLMAPKTSYLTILLGPGQVLQLYPPGLAGFLTYLSGAGFSGAFRSLPGVLSQLRPAAQSFQQELTWVSLALGLAGVAWLTRPRGRPLLVLTGVSFLIVVLFNLFYGIGDIGVYFIPAYLIWCLWLALGLGACAATLALLVRRLHRIPRVVEARLPVPHALLGILALLALALPLWLAGTNLTRLDQSQNRAAGEGWAELLAQPIPSGAVLVSNDRDEMMPLWYLQNVDHLRQDIVGLFPLILSGPDWSNVGRVTEQALASGRPVYLIKPMPGLEVKFKLATAGPLVRVLGPAVERLPQHPSSADYGDMVRLSGYDLLGAQVQPGGTVDLALYWQPQRELLADYTTYIHILNADGTVIGQSDHRPGGVYYPTSLWEPGELLRDVHTIHLTHTNLGPGPFSIRAGLYKRAPAIQNLGEPQVVGRLP
jgi:hypothetical protein